MGLQLYIEGDEVEMFKDESVDFVSSLQSVTDITKTSSDYSKTFNIPASAQNNKIFKHWYNVEIEGGFNSNIRKDAKLELNSMLFRFGRIELNSAVKRSGVITHYSITFYGNITALKDMFGNDYLTDLDLSAYAHDYYYNNVWNGLTTNTFFGGDVIYPLVSYYNLWNYGVGNSNDIKYTTDTGGSITYNELKPAIRLRAIIDAMEVKYGINFGGTFFDSDGFSKLVMIASKNKDSMKPYGSAQLLDFNGINTYNTYGTEPDYLWTFFEVTVTPDSAFITGVPYSIIIRKNGVEVGRTDVDYGARTISFNTSTLTDDDYSFYFQSDRYITFEAALNVTKKVGSDIQYPVINELTGSLISNSYVYFTDIIINNITVEGQLPKLKVIDFFKGLTSMFNLIVEPINNNDSNPNTFNIHAIEDWYASGVVKDFTTYIDLNKATIETSAFINEIQFRYQEPNTKEEVDFLNTNNRYYGDYDYTLSGNIGETLEIELPFETILAERLYDFSVTPKILTSLRVYKVIDSKFDPVETKPIILYNAGITDLTVLNDTIGLSDDSGHVNQIFQYNNIGQENDLFDSDITKSINWGIEQSSNTLLAINHSLYLDYWKNYIDSIDSEKVRLFKFDGVIPSGQINNLKLNDKLIINNRRYLIDKYTANLTTNKVKFELINDTVPQPLSGEVSAQGLEYESEFGLES